MNTWRTANVVTLKCDLHKLHYLYIFMFCIHICYIILLFVIFVIFSYLLYFHIFYTFHIFIYFYICQRKAHLNFIAAVGPLVPAISLAVIMDKIHRSCYVI